MLPEQHRQEGHGQSRDRLEVGLRSLEPAARTYRVAIVATYAAASGRVHHESLLYRVSLYYQSDSRSKLRAENVGRTNSCSLRFIAASRFCLLAYWSSKSRRFSPSSNTTVPVAGLHHSNGCETRWSRDRSAGPACRGGLCDVKAKSVEASTASINTTLSRTPCSPCTGARPALDAQKWQQFPLKEVEKISPNTAMCVHSVHPSCVLQLLTRLPR